PGSRRVVRPVHRRREPVATNTPGRTDTSTPGSSHPSGAGTGSAGQVRARGTGRRTGPRTAATAAATGTRVAAPARAAATGILGRFPYGYPGVAGARRVHVSNPCGHL